MLYDFLADFFDDDFFNFKPITSVSVGNVVCPNCSMSLSRFLHEGKFGCSECYNAFGKYTAQVLSNIHTSDEHKGKVYGEMSEQKKTENKLAELKKNLEKAVMEQRFEEAAKLRDEIIKLEKEGGKL